jgi:hypothetical protein
MSSSFDTHMYMYVHVCHNKIYNKIYYRETIVHYKRKCAIW